jgi:hypothetical protein
VSVVSIQQGATEAATTKLGWRTLRLKFSADLKVNRPIEKVFALLMNPDNQGKFDKSSIKMEVLTPVRGVQERSFGSCATWAGEKRKHFPRSRNWNRIASSLSAVRRVPAGSAHGDLYQKAPVRVCVGRVSS